MQQNNTSVIYITVLWTMLKSLSIYNITEYITVLNKVSVLLSSEKYSSTGKVLLVGLKVDIATVYNSLFFLIITAN